jgi:hypothetical protein
VTVPEIVARTRGSLLHAVLDEVLYVHTCTAGKAGHVLRLTYRSAAGMTSVCTEYVVSLLGYLEVPPLLQQPANPLRNS